MRSIWCPVGWASSADCSTAWRSGSAGWRPRPSGCLPTTSASSRCSRCARGCRLWDCWPSGSRKLRSCRYDRDNDRQRPGRGPNDRGRETINSNSLGKGASLMPIIDSQVHAYEANTPKRPWHSVPNWPDHVTGDEMVAAMDKVGVDGAIFISAFSMYRYDASYAVEVQRAHPGRFGIVKPVDPDDAAVADVVADWKKTAGTVGIRIMLTREN